MIVRNSEDIISGHNQTSGVDYKKTGSERQVSDSNKHTHTLKSPGETDLMVPSSMLRKNSDTKVDRASGGHSTSVLNTNDGRSKIQGNMKKIIDSKRTTKDLSLRQVINKRETTDFKFIPLDSPSGFNNTIKINDRQLQFLNNKTQNSSNSP